jgi:hypothetical protein
MAKAKARVSKPRMKKAAVLRKQTVTVPIWELSSITLMREGLRKIAADPVYGRDSSFTLLGCVACAEEVLTTHEVEGYGGMCCDCADGRADARALPWAEEFTRLHKRGLRL